MGKRLLDSEVELIIKQRQTAGFWQKHICRLRNEGLVDLAVLKFLINLGVTNAKRIGYNEGQICPGKPGQWDVFCRLSGQTSEINRLILSDLSTFEAIKIMRDSRLSLAGVDPNNPQEVREFWRVQNMSAKEVRAQIRHDPELEQLLEKRLSVNDKD